MTPSDPAPASRTDIVARAMVAMIVLGMAVVVGRVAQLQLHPPAELVAHMPDRASSRSVEGYRGDLLDRAGRLLATSRMGYRAFVDPVELAAAIDQREIVLDDVIVKLAEALGEEPAEIGSRITRGIMVNRERLGAAASKAPDEAEGGLSVLLAALHAKAGDSERDVPEVRLRRYLVVSDVLKPHEQSAVTLLDLPGVHLERRSVRAYPGGELAASIVGKVGFEQEGLLGAERLLEDELRAEDGRVSYIRDAWGRPLWIEQGAVQQPAHGRDVRLSLDLEVQRIALEELQRGVEDADAAGGRVVVVDPATGEVLAIADIYRPVEGLADYPWQPKDSTEEWPVPARRYKTLPDDFGRLEHPALGRARSVEDVYEPGSTFKPIVWALLTEAGLAQPDDIIDTEGGRWMTSYRRRIEDVSRRQEMTWLQVLELSSNIGMVKIGERMSGKDLRDGILRFGFGTRTGTRLPGEAAGIITSERAWNKYTHTSVSFGHEISVTPVQMVRAYCALVRTGEQAGTMPSLRMTMPHEASPADTIIERIVDPESARLARVAMRDVGIKIEERMKDEAPAGGWWYPMLGKSGTAEIPLGRAPEGFKRPRGARGYFEDQYNSSFVAAAPAHQPQLVAIVVIDDPGPGRIRARSHYGSAVAGPVVRRVLERSLRYLGVPPARDSRTVAAR